MLIKISPKKSLGQNFLVNPRILDKIVAAAEITKDDTILEVGPGTGNLTKKLAEKAKKVIAVEKDKRLVGFLKNKFSENSAIAEKSEIIEGDFLKLNVSRLKFQLPGYKIVANIPYYITSRFLRTVLNPSSRTSPSSVHYGARKWPKPKLIVLTIQKEVAQRIMARPPKMNLLAVSVQFFAEPKIVGYISKENFWPRPKVDSAIIRLTPINADKKATRIDADKLFKIIRAGFSNKRKQLLNSLSNNLKKEKEEMGKILKKAGINPESRPEELTVENWIEITELLK